jgi:thiamine transport system substrate-binding protein
MMKRSVLTLTALAVMLTALLAVSAPDASPATPVVSITLVTHDSFAVSKSVLAGFTKQTRITVKILQAGDAGAALNQVILTKDHPIGDVFFGVDNTFLGRAQDAHVFRIHTAVGYDQIPDEYKLYGLRTLMPVDHGDVCINYDKQWFADHHLAVPKTLDDLTKPAYKGQLVVEDPATSSPGLAFVLATVARYGADGWRGYWEKLRANGNR